MYLTRLGRHHRGENHAEAAALLAEVTQKALSLPDP
jgi:hypothetical protein